VRLSSDIVLRLNAASKKLGLNNRSAIMKLAIVTQLSQIEAGYIKLIQEGG
jgi:hypothetical protein